MFRHLMLIMAVLCSLFYGCSGGPPSTKDRSISHPPQPGGTDVLKVCTERPPSYTASVESQLKAVLPLLEKTEVQAEAIVNAFLSQQPRGTQRGEDLNNYLFYICQMAIGAKLRQSGLSIGSLTSGLLRILKNKPRNQRLK